MDYRVIAEWNEPINGAPLRLIEIQWTDLKNSPFQRAESTGLKNKLASSITHGFFVPLLVVRYNGEWVIVDGQHRKAAIMKAKGNIMVTCIEVPLSFMYQPLIYNVEMGDKIKDTCLKVHALYCQLAMEQPETLELSIAPMLLNSPHFATLAFAHVENELSSPSLVETAVKKFDDWTKLPLNESIEERRSRACMVADLEASVNSVAARDGFREHPLKAAVITKTNVALWGKARNVSEEFSTAIQMMIDHIESSDWSFLSTR